MYQEKERKSLLWGILHRQVLLFPISSIIHYAIGTPQITNQPSELWTRVKQKDYAEHLS